MLESLKWVNMNKTIAIVICLSAIFLSACGKSAQEKVAEEQLKQIERSKNIMGDGTMRRPVRGNKNSLTDK